MQNNNRKNFFTADARLTFKRVNREIAPAKFAADGSVAEPAKVESIATLTGYPIIWNAVSTDRGGYKVKLMPNSAQFAAPTQALWHHDPARVLGNTANGTLRLIPDTIGVRSEIDLPDTTDGNDAEELVEQKYVTGMSFSMVNAPDGQMTTVGGEQIFEATSFLSDEVTITGIPSFTQTSIEVAKDNEPEDDGDYQKNNAQNWAKFERLRLETLCA